MKLITQKEDCACFPAALATVANISYENAKKLVDGRKTKKTWNKSGPDWVQVRSSFDKVGLYYREYENIDVKSFYQLKQLKNNALLIIVSPYDKISTHTVVWDYKKQIILDPSQKNGFKPYFKKSYQYVKHIMNIYEVIKKNV